MLLPIIGFFFKQKTTYEIHRWLEFRRVLFRSQAREAITGDFLEGLSREAFRIAHDVSSYSFPEIGRASCRERVEISVVVVPLKNKRVEPRNDRQRTQIAHTRCSCTRRAAQLVP